MKYEEYKDKRGEWRWRIVAKNGRIVAESGEGYKRRATMRKAITEVVYQIKYYNIVGNEM